MPEYILRLGTEQGDVVERTTVSDNEGLAREEFENKGFYIFSVKKKGTLSEALSSLSLREYKIKISDFLIFNQEFMALIKAGLPMIQCLDVIIRRRTDQRFREILENIRDQVKSGASLSEAFASQGDTFSKIYTSSLMAGEMSGDLVNVLKRYIKYAKLIADLRKKIISAFVYPTILIIFSISLIAILLTFVIPKFQSFYANMEAELPVPTRILIFVSNFAKENILFILLGAIALAFLFRIWKKTETGSVLLDRMKLKLPFLGRIYLKHSITQLTRTLSTVLGGGIPLVPSLEIAAQGISNRVVSLETTQAAHKVREGQSLASSLEETGLMTDLAIEMIEVGESTGSLEEMLNNISDFYDVEIDNFLAKMITIIEPVILIFMGIMVAGMLLSIYLPLFKALETVK